MDRLLYLRVLRVRVVDLLIIVVGLAMTLVTFNSLLRLRFIPALEPSLLLSCIVVPVFLLDVWLTKQSNDFADELYEYVKDVGRAVLDGDGVESALLHVGQKRGGSVARVFFRVLARAEYDRIDRALQREAQAVGDPTFTEVAELLAMLSASDGPIGESITALGVRLAETRAAERANERTLFQSIVLWLFFGLVGTPAAASYMSNLSEQPLSDWGYRFYGLLALALSQLQWVLFGSLRRMCAQLPLFIFIVYGVIVSIQASAGVPVASP